MQYYFNMCLLTYFIIVFHIFVPHFYISYPNVKTLLIIYQKRLLNCSQKMAL